MPTLALAKASSAPRVGSLLTGPDANSDVLIAIRLHLLEALRS